MAGNEVAPRGWKPGPGLGAFGRAVLDLILPPTARSTAHTGGGSWRYGGRASVLCLFAGVALVACDGGAAPQGRAVEVRLSAIDGVDASNATVSRLVYAVGCSVPGRRPNDIGEFVHGREQLVQTGDDGEARMPKMTLDRTILKSCGPEKTRVLVQVFRGVDKPNDLRCEVFSGLLSDLPSNLVLECR